MCEHVCVNMCVWWGDTGWKEGREGGRVWVDGIAQHSMS